MPRGKCLTSESGKGQNADERSTSSFKIVVIGAGKEGLPIILGGDSAPAKPGR